MFDALLRIYRLEGFSRLFRGFSANLIRQAPSNALTIWFYVEISKILFKS